MAGIGKDSYICLDVGGTLYRTSLSTLTSVPNSMLGSMFREGGIPVPKDTNGHFFIDRDGPMFRYVLNFIRNRKLCLPSTFVEYDQLLAEADFFQLPDLKEAILLKMSIEKEVVIVNITFKRVLGQVCVVQAKRETWPSLKHLNNSGAISEELSIQDEDHNYPHGTAFISKYFKMGYFGPIAACLTEDGFTHAKLIRDRITSTCDKQVLLFSRESSKS